MGVDTNAFLNSRYDPYDIFECLKKSRKANDVRVALYDDFARGRIDIEYNWQDDDRYMGVNFAREGDYDEIPQDHMLQIHFAFRSTSQPICEYILGHCGGGWVKYKDTDDHEDYKQVYPYGKQIKPGRNYFRKLLDMHKEKEQIYNFFMGSNRDKIKIIFS